MEKYSSGGGEVEEEALEAWRLFCIETQLKRAPSRLPIWNERERKGQESLDGQDMMVTVTVFCRILTCGTPVGCIPEKMHIGLCTGVEEEEA